MQLSSASSCQSAERPMYPEESMNVSKKRSRIFAAVMTLVGATALALPQNAYADTGNCIFDIHEDGTSHVTCCSWSDDGKCLGCTDTKTPKPVQPTTGG